MYAIRSYYAVDLAGQISGSTQVGCKEFGDLLGQNL